MDKSKFSAWEKREEYLIEEQYDLRRWAEYEYYRHAELVCPYLRGIDGVWYSLGEHPCRTCNDPSCPNSGKEPDDIKEVREGKHIVIKWKEKDGVPMVGISYERESDEGDSI